MTLEAIATVKEILDERGNGDRTPDAITSSQSQRLSPRTTSGGSPAIAA